MAATVLQENDSWAPKPHIHDVPQNDGWNLSPCGRDRASSSANEATNAGCWRSWELNEEVWPTASSDPPSTPSHDACSSQDFDAAGWKRTLNMQTDQMEIDVEPTDDSEPGGLLASSSIGAGLTNLGNTCFVNSVLQCLTYTRPIINYLISSQHKTLCRADEFCAMCAFEDHVKEARSSSGRVISPSHLVNNLNCISESFHLWQQEDAHEYMLYLIEALHKCCMPCGSASETSFLSRIFGGRLKSQVKCTLCQHCSDTFDPFLDLSLEIDKSSSLLDALANFTTVETVEEENKYQCAQCKREVVASKQLTIDQPPEVLAIQLKRFNVSGAFGTKLDKIIQFDMSLDLRPFITDRQTDKENGFNYTLYAILVHSGWSTSSGHYYCFVRTSSRWHVLNDSWVRRVSEKTVLEQKAYMLFYVRDCIDGCFGVDSNLVKLSPGSSPLSSQTSYLKPSSKFDAKEMNVNCCTGSASVVSSDACTAACLDGPQSTVKQESKFEPVTTHILPTSSSSFNQERSDGLWSKLAENEMSPMPLTTSSPKFAGLSTTSVDKDATAFAGSHKQSGTSDAFAGSPQHLGTSDAFAKTEMSQQSRKFVSPNLEEIPPLTGGKNTGSDSCSKFQKGTQQSYMKILSSMPASRRAHLTSALPPPKANGQLEDDAIKVAIGNSKAARKKRPLQDAKANQMKKHHQVVHSKSSKSSEKAVGTTRQNDPMSADLFQRISKTEAKDISRVSEIPIAEQYSDDLGNADFQDASRREFRSKKRLDPLSKASKDRKRLSNENPQNCPDCTEDPNLSNVAVKETDDRTNSDPLALSALELNWQEESLETEVDNDDAGCKKLQEVTGGKRALASLAGSQGSSRCNKGNALQVGGPVKISRFFHRVVPGHVTEGIM